MAAIQYWANQLNTAPPTQPNSVPSKNLRHFACPLRALRSGILIFWKSARILRSSGIWHFFRIFDIPLPRALIWHTKWIDFFRPGTVRICMQVPGWNRSIQFACQLEALKSGKMRIWKSAIVLRSSGGWHFFWICNILRVGRCENLCFAWTKNVDSLCMSVWSI
jgi:hypothetical protein